MESKQEEVTHEVVEDSNKSNDTSAQSNEQPVVQVSKQETENKDQGTDTEAKKELEDYSEGVKKRIAKLTKKMREAERQREAAIEYARKIQGEKESLAGRLTKLDTGYVTEMENRIKSSMEAAAAKLAQAITTKPSKLKPGSKAAKRRKSFCARMSGMKKRLTSAKTARDPNSRINKSLRKWNC